MDHFDSNHIRAYRFYHAILHDVSINISRCRPNGTKLYWPAVECYRRRQTTTDDNRRQRSSSVPPTLCAGRPVITV